ncbi:MAG: hypothetical protein ACREXY_03295 [Gammaproteobacteria bacterium]
MTRGEHISSKRGKENAASAAEHEAEHLPAIERALAARLGLVPRCLFLRGDTCRGALLIEIEGILSFANAEPVGPGER